METTQTDYGLEKLDKSKMLNANMSIQPQQPDDYESKVHTTGGAN